MTRFIVILVMYLVSTPVTLAAQFRVSEQVEVETIGSIDVGELWSLTVQSKIDSGGVSAIFQLYDPEMRLRRGDWVACAIVMIGTGDLGIAPVAFRIWARRDCQLAISKFPTQEAQSQAFMIKIGESVPFLLSVLNEKSVSIQGINIGIIEQPK